VLVKTDRGTILAWRHVEVCVFAALAATLKAGDVAVDGSDAYAGYREQLQCEPHVVDYCEAVELPTTATALPVVGSQEETQHPGATSLRMINARSGMLVSAAAQSC
jgi:hypothetical protein